MSDDTIFALASGAAPAAIAVIRISGPDSGAVLDGLCRQRPPPRHASLRKLRDHLGDVLDHALVLWMPGPASYSGEDAAELHLHGGHAVVEDVSAALVHLGARPAEAGEFSRRAFLNGRLDLTAVEAVADLAAAETSAQRRQALRQLGGELDRLMQVWAAGLRRILAEQQALIDFPDEDLPPEMEVRSGLEISRLIREIETHIDGGHCGERLRVGLVFVVTGPPNVGKSSLVNALAERDVAITSATPGTTRDSVEARIVLGGVPVTLVDTAGLRCATDPVEREGVRRAEARAAAADLVVKVSAPGAVTAATYETRGRVVRVMNKADLAPAPLLRHGSVLIVSARTGYGLDELRTALADQARALTRWNGPPPLTRARHRAALRDVTLCLRAALDERLPELRAENIRLSLASIGRVTGQIGVEDVLDTIFREFCIGK